MSEVTPKSTEVIQAQVAAYAAERVEHYQDRGHIFNNLGSLAVEGLQDVTRVTDGAEYHQDANGETVRVPEGTERAVATVEDYKSFLRSVGGSKYEGIEGRAEILNRYGEFSPTINHLREELADLATRKEHTAYLGNGSNSTVFSIERDGKQYAVRVPNGKAANPGVVDSHIAGAYLGKGVPHLEQIVAASYEDGVTVAEIMPGKEMGDLSVEDIRAITDEQLGELVDTLVAVSERGIEIDPKPSNFFYDREAGFGIVDYHSSKVQKNSKDQELGEIVSWAATPIDNAGFYGKPYKSERTAQDYASDLEYKKASLDVLKRYREVVATKLQGEVRENALKGIDEKVGSLEETVQNYSSPEWVNERLADEEKWRQQRDEQANKQKSPTDGWITLDTV